MRYDAFISYSHAADDTLAPAVQRSLQLLARPWNKRRALEVFRDDTGLAVSPGLWTSICAGLDESKYFVLLASPEAAASTWVNQEIEHWSASHPIDCLLPVVTAGEWMWDAAAGDFDLARSTAVPNALRGLFSEEPRHLDLRWAHSETDLDLRNSRFREAVAQLAAPMHSMAPEDIEGADVARYKRLVQVRRAVVASLTVLLVLVSVAGVLALKNASTAREQRAAAEASKEEAQQLARQRLADKLLAQAELEDRRNKALGLLLRAQAARLSPQDSWGALVSSVGANPGLTKLYDLPREGRAARWHALSANGELFAWGTERGPIQLWDVAGGHASRQPLTCAGAGMSPCTPLDAEPAVFGLAATDLVFSPAGVLAAAYPGEHENAAVGSGGIVLWSTDTGSGHLLPKSFGFAGMAFDADGGRIAAVDHEGTVRVWDARTHRMETTLPAPSAGPPTDLAFSRDTALLFESVRGGTARIFVWPLGGPRPAARPSALLMPAGYAEELVAGPHGVLASLDGAGNVLVWNARARTLLGPLATDGTAVTDMAFSADGTLATAGRDGLLRLWDSVTRAQRAHASRAGDGGSTAQLAFTPDGGRLISVSDDVRVWDVSQWGRAGQMLYQHEGAVTAVAVSSTGLLATGDDHGGIWLFALDDPQADPQVLQRRGPAVGALDFSSAGVLAVGSADGFVNLWDTSSGQPVGDGLDGHGDAVTSVSFAPDGRLLAAAYRRPAEDVWPRPPIRVWDTEAELIQVPLPAGLAADVNDLDFSPLTELAAAGRDFGSIWDPSTWGSKTLPADSAVDYFAVAFSADGSTLVSSEQEAEGAKYRVSLWDIPGRSARPVHITESELSGAPPRALAFGLADSLIAGAGPGGVQLWDAVGLEPIGGPLGLSATSIAFSADDGQLIVGEQDGLVQTYPTSVVGWQDAVCSIVGRNLTQAEWATFAGDEEPYASTCPQYE